MSPDRQMTSPYDGVNKQAQRKSDVVVSSRPFGSSIIMPASSLKVDNKTTVDFVPSSVDKEGSDRHASGKTERSSSTTTVSTLATGDSAVLSAEVEYLHIAKDFTSRLVQVQHRRRWEIHDTILDVIGQTPIVKLTRMAPAGVNVYVKCENNNPGGSHKDRLAMGVIEWAEKTGKLRPGQTVVEASKGNAGIAMAMVCAVKGYPFVCVMNEIFSVERRKLMRFLGARVILTKKEYKATGMLIKAQELADKHGFFYPKQFENEANAWIHEKTTGVEIVNAFGKVDRQLDHFFMAYGTGGTILGVSRALRENSPKTKIHLVEPANAPMVSSGIATRYPASGIPSTSFDTGHPVWNPHVFQGIATDFIPKLVSIAKAEGGYDRVCKVKGDDGINTSRDLAHYEGIFTGSCGGGILASCLKFAQTCPAGTNLLAILPDTGERYLSTELFDIIPAEMTEEEIWLSNSTPSRPPPAPAAMHGLMPLNTDSLFDV